MNFLGLTTQKKACEQRPDYCGTNLDNTPQTAYYQLYTELNNDPDTTQEEFYWPTDMRWLHPNP